MTRCRERSERGCGHASSAPTIPSVKLSDARAEVSA